MIDIRKFSGFEKFKKRFLSKLPLDYKEKKNQNSCWLWQGTIHKTTGYGEIGWSGDDKYFAHRISYIIFKGLIPQGKIIRHTCDNRLCVNPNHLILGTHSDNSIDSVKRNRQGHQKLNSECVKVIRWILKNNYYPGVRKKLAKIHYVTRQTILDIEAVRSWAWVQI